MLCSVDINKATELEFTLQVLGSTAKSVEPRFVIVGPDFAVVCLCNPTGETIKVRVPKLEGILAPGKYKVRFEVILGEQIFTPIEDEIELKATVKIEAAMSSVKEKKQPKIAVSFSDPKKESIELPQAPIVEAIVEPVVEMVAEPTAEEVIEEDVEEVTPAVIPSFVDTNAEIALYLASLKKESLAAEDKKPVFSFIKTLKR